MTPDPFDVGVYVVGAKTAPRVLARHADLLAAYADGLMVERGETREAYLSHFAFGPEMRAHYAEAGGSVAGYSGPCGARTVILDIDRPDLGDALADARRLVGAIYQRYPELEGDVPVHFSGAKGFAVGVELAHRPPPAPGFQLAARAFAEALAARAGVRIDTDIYDVNRLIRLPNTRHPRTGLYKRRVDAEALFRLDVPGLLAHARHPAGDGLPAARAVPTRLADDWAEAARAAGAKAAARAAARTDFGPAAARAPRYLLDFLRFGVGEGERHGTLFRCAAWLAEQGAPPALAAALLTEPGRDLGLAPKDVARQIACGVEYARRRSGPVDGRAAEPPPDPDAAERWAVRSEDGPLPVDALDFPFGPPAAAGEGGPW